MYATTPSSDIFNFPPTVITYQKAYKEINLFSNILNVISGENMNLLDDEPSNCKYLVIQIKLICSFSLLNLKTY